MKQLKPITTDEFKRKIQKIKLNNVRVRAAGNGYAFFIPKSLIDANVITGSKKYELVVNEFVDRDVVREVRSPNVAVV